MTQNKPVIAEAARKLLTGANSKLENDMLDMISRLADVITHNAGAMNKLVDRVSELEKLVPHESGEKAATEVGEFLENLLADKNIAHVKCTVSKSTGFIVGQVYTVKTDERMGTKYILSDSNTRYTGSQSQFVQYKQKDVQPVVGYKLSELLANPLVQRVKCVKSNSSLWIEGKTYVVLCSTSTLGSRKVKSEHGKLLATSASLFVEVKPEPSELVNFIALMTKEQRIHMFLEQTRMFMGFPQYNYLTHAAYKQYLERE